MTTRPLVGRRHETRRLADALAPRPHGSVLLVLGDPGIGKTALLEQAGAVARAAGRRTLTVVGVEAEAAFPFAGLHQVLSPLLPEIDAALAPARRRALLAALGLDEGPSPDPFQVAQAAFELLAASAVRQPVAVLADDVQWLDGQSQEVLVYVGRMASSAPLCLIAAVRTGHPGPFLAAGFPELVLQGVDEASAARILADGAPDLRPDQRDRILRESMGNPLALRELPSAVRTGAAPVSGLKPLPLSTRLERAFAGQVAALPEATRNALLIAAVDSRDHVEEILRAAGRLTGGSTAPETPAAEDLAPALTARLVTVADGRLGFRHPLVRSGVLQAAGSTRVQAAHAALAGILDGDPYRRIRHLAQAILGPDDEVADALRDCAATAAGRGDLLAAIADLERSAQLSASSTARGHRLLDAAEHGFALGRVDLVDELVRAAFRCDLTDLDRARAEWLSEIFDDGIPGDAPRVFQLCDMAGRAATGGEPGLALNLLLGAALRCWWADTAGPAPDRIVDVARGPAAPAADDPRHTAVLAVAAPLSQCSTVRRRLDEVCPDAPMDADTLRLLGMAAHAVGDEAKAVELLDAAAGRLRDDGRLALLSQVLSMQVMARLDLGDLIRAGECAKEGEQLARQTGQPVWRTGTLACDSILAALVGRAAQALRMAAEAELEAGRRQLNDLLSCVQLARGLAFLSLGRDRDAYLALRRCFDVGDPAFHRRERFGALAFLADAAVRAGHVADARTVLADLEATGGEVPSPILHAHLAYARAVLADDADAGPRFDALFADGSLSVWALLRAKAELAHGTWLRRRGRHAEAQVRLAGAGEALERIGATPWARLAAFEAR